MTLNTLDTALLKSALDCQKTSTNSFTYWLEHDTTAVDNTQYSAIKTKFDAWQVAYEEEDLYITTGSGAQQVQGIDRVPVIVSR